MSRGESAGALEYLFGRQGLGPDRYNNELGNSVLIIFIFMLVVLVFVASVALALADLTVAQEPANADGPYQVDLSPVQARGTMCCVGVPITLAIVALGIRN